MEQVQQARRQGIPWLNASSEKLLESKMFRDAALKEDAWFWHRIFLNGAVLNLQRKKRK